MVRRSSSRVAWRIGDQTELIRGTAFEVRASVLEDTIVTDVVVIGTGTILAEVLGVKRAPAGIAWSEGVRGTGDSFGDEVCRQEYTGLVK